MTSSDEDYTESNDESEYVQPHRSSITQKKHRAQQSPGSSEEDLPLESDSEDHKQNLQMEEEEDGEPQQEQSESPEGGIFFPDIEQILWKRTKQDQGQEQTYEYLVKYKEYSYIHCEWIEEKEVLAGEKNSKQKLNRFNKTFEKRLKDLEVDQDDPLASQFYFDTSYVEVDRILSSTDMFQVIHPKKANEIKEKWTELLVQVVHKLLTYTKDNVKYGICFMEPINPETDGCPNYRKVITQPMDLGTVSNRLYLDYYQNYRQFWYELGLVFKNCRKYNKEETCELRILCDTLREVALIFYRQWHQAQTQQYEYLIELSISVQKPTEKLIEIVLSQVREENRKRQKEQLEIERSKELIIYFKEEPFEQPLEQIVSVDQKSIKEYLSSHNIQIPTEWPEEIGEDHVQMKSIELIQLLRDKFNFEAPLQLQIMEQEEEIMRITHQKIQYDLNKFKQVFEKQSEMELRNPGLVTLEWLQDDEVELSIDNFEFIFLTIDEQQNVNLKQPIDTLYLIKWKNLSYLQVTWEPLSILNLPPSKLNEFRQFNRALDRETRSQMIQDCQNHRQLLDWEQNPKKKARMTQNQILEIKNSLYQLDIAQRKTHVKYTARNQPVYKDRRLLRDYQLESLNWMIEAYYSNRNVLLADEMGLGKTIQSIAFLNYLYSLEGQRGPFLIVAPLTTLMHWKRTVEDWTTLNGVTYYDTHGIEGRQACSTYEYYYNDISTKGSVIVNKDLHKFQIMITSYEVFNQDIQYIIHIPFKFVVIDEAHRLKNQNAKILTTLRRLPCKRVMILTGTPVQNNTDELWSLLNFIEPNKFNSLMEFKQDFGELTTAEQIEKLNQTLKPYILRRQKEDVEQSIPPLQENIIDIEMTTLQKTVYRALYERNKSTLLKGFAALTAQAATLNNLEMQLRKCCNHPMLIKELFKEMTGNCGTDAEYFKVLVESSGKMILLDKMLNKFVQEKKKVLIFSQFTQMLALLEDYLINKQFKYEKITGEVKSTERQNSIDRFNDPARGRNVFLLSTKAGGQGINLTAAEVVIIYDSDWNPQNDVQATARAHRIGQEKEVAVYRLITKNTYESEMFERATKKLGLDQAIFMSGEFKQTNTDGTQDIGNKKLSKQEMEMLLKRGCLGLLEQNQQEDQDKNILEQDIDDILNNTRIAKYSLIQGSYTISKQSYISEKNAQDLDVNDPNFWQIVLKNQETKSMKLLKKLDQDYKSITATFQSQKQFLLEVADCINSLVEAKLSLQGFNADDENNIMDILNQVAFKTEFNAGLRDTVTNWIYEVNKPSRRFKKITEQDLDLKKQDIIQTVQQEKPKTISPPKDFNWSDTEESKRLAEKTPQELMGRLCSACERPKCTNFCRGFCRQQFHEQCRDLPRGSKTQQKPLEMDWDIEKLKQNINVKFLCSLCSKFEVECFFCKKTASYMPKRDENKPEDSQNDKLNLFVESKRNRTRASFKKFSESITTFATPVQEVVKCSIFNCPKFYHFACAQTQKNFKILDGQSQKFKCPLHYCSKCQQKSEEHQGVLQCLRCPRAFHQKCLTKDIHKYNKKFLVCNEHKLVKSQNDQPQQKPLQRSESPQLQIRKKQKNSETTQLVNKQKKEEKLSNKTKDKLKRVEGARNVDNKQGANK